MKKLTPRLPLTVTGILFGLAILSLSTYIGLYSVRDDPELRRLFQHTLAIEAIAVVTCTPAAVIDALVAHGKIKLSTRAQICAPGVFYFISFTIVLFSAIRLNNASGDFLALMSVAAHWGIMFTLVSILFFIDPFLSPR